MEDLTQRLVLQAKGKVHSQVQVVQEGSFRYLRFGTHGGWQGAFNTEKPEQIVFPYQRAFAALASSLPSIQSFLALGVGTGTALRTVRETHPSCALFGMDIEETVIETAISHFSCPSHEEVQYFVGDGIQLLHNQPFQFSLIFVDAYLRDKIYVPVMEPSFLMDLQRSLTSDGIVVFNMIDRFFTSAVRLPFYQTLCRLFPMVLIQPVGFPLTEQNGLVVALTSRQTNLLAKWRSQTLHSTFLHRYERWIQSFRIRLLS